MKKLKFSPPNSIFVSTVRPIKEYVLRFERVAESLVVRLFRLYEKDRLGEFEVLPVVEPAVSLGATALRKRITSLNYVAATALTADTLVATKVAAETGRYTFSPTITASVELGAGERNDFAAFVFSMNTDGELDEPYNWFTQSANVKGSLARTAKLRDAPPLFLLYSDKAGAEIDDWTLICIESQLFITQDTTAGVVDTLDADFVMWSLLPSVNLSSAASVAAGSEILVNVTVSRAGTTINYDGELVVEAVSGYVPNTRVAIHNGIGTFKAMALGLTTGDTLRVKLGTKNITGMASLSIPVA